MGLAETNLLLFVSSVVVGSILVAFALLLHRSNERRRAGSREGSTGELIRLAVVVLIIFALQAAFIAALACASLVVIGLGRDPNANDEGTWASWALAVWDVALIFGFARLIGAFGDTKTTRKAWVVAGGLWFASLVVFVWYAGPGM